jgi:hypothetical protein
MPHIEGRRVSPRTRNIVIAAVFVTGVICVAVLPALFLRNFDRSATLATRSPVDSVSAKPSSTNGANGSPVAPSPGGIPTSFPSPMPSGTASSSDPGNESDEFERICGKDSQQKEQKDWLAGQVDYPGRLSTKTDQAITYSAVVDVNATPLQPLQKSQVMRRANVLGCSVLWALGLSRSAAGLK